MNQEEFSTHFKGAFRKLWLVAAGVLHDRSGADDAVQEAAVVALGKLGEFQAGTSFEAWMSQIVRFVALNRAKKQRGRRTQAVEPDVLDATHAAKKKKSTVKLSKSGLVRVQETFDDDLARELDELSPVARQCLLLRTVGELDYDEISRMLDIPANTAMSHVHRARGQLRRALVGSAASREEAST